MRMRYLLTVMLVLLTFLGASADPLPFTPIYIDETTKLSDEAVKAAVDGLAAQNPKPDHVYVLIHGFDVPREDSLSAFTTVSERIRKLAAADKSNPVILGIQWASASEESIFGMEEDYFNKTLRARATGRFGVRQLLVAVEKRFPGVPVTLMAHSMGCEASAAAIRTDLKFDDEVTASLGAFAPDQAIPLNAWIMCGSDLDYDFAYKGGISGKAGNTSLIWMTMASYLDKEHKDKVLKLRKVIRGEALGSVLPKLTEEQWKSVADKHLVVFDGENIPRSHDYLEYYSEARLKRILQAARHTATPNLVPPGPDLAVIDQVMKAPNNAQFLATFLDNPSLSARIYALYRLETLLCGGPKHLSDGLLDQQVKRLKNQPQAVRRERDDCPCQVMRQGWFPTEAQFTKAGAPKWAENR